MSIRLDDTGMLVEIHDVEDSDQWASVGVFADAAAIDRFERELIRLAEDRAGTARLDPAP